mmetsp:Transcript_7929/g.12818  ORF Transcript_7929/g.12818 Transcript_7929/m.12818 type:complete len:97 (+) Transcript_7929:1091-1381(+)
MIVDTEAMRSQSYQVKSTFNSLINYNLEVYEAVFLFLFLDFSPEVDKLVLFRFLAGAVLAGRCFADLRFFNSASILFSSSSVSGFPNIAVNVAKAF